MRWLRLDARNRFMAVLAIGTFALLVGSVTLASSLLASHLRSADQDRAEGDARLIADVVHAAALADGRLDEADARAARKEFAAAQRSRPLTGAIVWSPAGRVVFSTGDGIRPRGRGLPTVVRAALKADETRSGYAPGPGSAPQVAAAIPMQFGPRRTIAEFFFSQAGTASNVAAAKRRLYALGGVAALLIYLGMLPLLARLARRLPPRVSRARRTALAGFRDALTRGEICVHYQPKLAVKTDVIVGVEALVRWNHPSRGLVLPAQFLPLVGTDPDLLYALTTRVLDCALRDCRRWQRRGVRLPVAINIEESVLVAAPLAEVVRYSLDRHGIDPRLLTLEITETAIMEGGEQAIGPLQELRKLGVAISLDDFGTGYSSLGRLRSLPIDELKVDRSFVAGVATDNHDLVTARLVVDLGSDLGLLVVAEGVEDEPTLTVLTRLGCPVVQGFLIARPMPENELLEWVETRRVAEVVSPSGSVERAR